MLISYHILSGGWQHSTQGDAASHGWSIRFKREKSVVTKKHQKPTSAAY